MCRGPLAYGQATAVSTRALMRPTLVAGPSADQPVIACGHLTGRRRGRGGCGGGRHAEGTHRDPQHRRHATARSSSSTGWPSGSATWVSTSTCGRSTWPTSAGGRTTRARRSIAPRRGAWSRPTSPGERPALILQGHVDVVPTGDPAAWTGEPFQPQGQRRTGGRAGRLRHEGWGRRHPRGGGDGAAGRVDRAAVRGALRGRRGGRWSGRVRDPGPRPPRGRLHHPGADRPAAWSRPTPGH